ncbi:unnamed protein product [Lota lota]
MTAAAAGLPLSMWSFAVRLPEVDPKQSARSPGVHSLADDGALEVGVGAARGVCERGFPMQGERTVDRRCRLKDAYTLGFKVDMAASDPVPFCRGLNTLCYP